MYKIGQSVRLNDGEWKIVGKEIICLSMRRVTIFELKQKFNYLRLTSSELRRNIR